MKVAAIQTSPVFRQKRENLRRLATLVTQAAEAGAKLIVMPELATTGYTYMKKAEALEDAETISLREGEMISGTMSIMWALARKFDIYLIWGMVEKDIGSGKVYNTQVYLEPNGYFESYRKINRWGNDYLWATAGISNPPVIKAGGLDGKRVGLLICRDVRDKVNDDWKNLYSPGDADIVALSANWGDGGFPAVSWMEFATENKVTLIVSNRWGQEGPNDFGEGGICVIDPDGEVHCDGLLWSQDCIVYSEVR